MHAEREVLPHELQGCRPSRQAGRSASAMMGMHTLDHMQA